ncbi:Sensor histidine kinase regulating citrate/malate metabolism [Pseudonocardia thermophila]|jgi:Signal transduction histidine kinase regulating citrate/malate metabolism|uniref:Sensor-like histidine kinase SenX3 n=1 Tax=Pseudonocardia thermophila TaxID=1848 RepID=A0A1M6ZGB6_PSETH|nr:sensor histidine kinase [Pseudonocardia thermophila]SHL29393.1 Sensor histidine kinase regulating citrate/malate metabolism [Pseudonocardia thermophila]
MAATVSFIAFARSWSLARRVFVLQAAVVALVLTGVTAGASAEFGSANDEAAAREMLGIAHTLAADPAVAAALAAPNPTELLQPLAEDVRRRTATDFVVVMTSEGIRYTHPTPTEVGRRFLGTIAPAAQGRPITETFTGTLGPSVRAVVPVEVDGQVVALVSVGRRVTAVAAALGESLSLVLGIAALALVVAAAGTWLISRWLRRTTHDLGPAELSRMYAYYGAVLHSVREGMLLLDPAGRVQLVNDEARRLLGLSGEVVGRPVTEAVGAPLGPALAERAVAADEIHLTAEHIVVVNQQPAVRDGRDLGTVVTLRDHTELRALTDELQTIRGFADSLNAQAHEAANRLHTVVALIELGRADEALAYAEKELAVAQQLTDAVLAAVEVPELAALVVGKAAQAAERGVELTVADTAHVPAGAADPRDLVTIVGNLLDNAIDAALEGGAPRWVRFDAQAGDGELVLAVQDSGPGIDPAVADRLFVRGFSTKAAAGPGRGLGLALVSQAAHRNGGRAVAANHERGAVFTVRLPLRAGRRVPA